MKWLAFLAVLTLVQPALAESAAPPQAAGPSTPMTPAPDDRAKQWLMLVDDQNYSDAYKQMSASAQTKTSLAAWSMKMGQNREPLGAMASRTIKDVKLTKTLPGMRDGQYATVQFDSGFAHKVGAVESVVLTSEKGGWSVVSYSVN